MFSIPAPPQSTYTSVLPPHGHHILSLSSSSLSQGSFFICEQKFAPTIFHHCQLVFSLLVMNFQRNRTNEVHIYSVCVCVCIYAVCFVAQSVMSNSVIPWTVAHQAPLSMEILQARILEWVAMPSSRGSSQPRD